MDDSPEPEVLVALELDDGRAGVVYADGRHLLCSSLEDEGGVEVVDARPCSLGVAGGRRLIGGLLPPGAVAAEVVDLRGRRWTARTGRGAWIALLEEAVQRMSSPVCFRDASGEFVRPRLPDDWARRPVEDADQACPACGGRAWEEVVPSDGSRGMHRRGRGELEPMPIVVCQSCGFEERVGSWATMRSVTAANQEDKRRQIEMLRRQMHERRRRALAEVRFPIYVDAERPAQLSGWGGGDDGIENVTVSYAQPASGRQELLKIDTALRGTRPADEEAIVRGELENWLVGPKRVASQGLSEPARALAWRAARREGQRLAAEAQLDVRMIDVNGREQPFAYLESSERWVAARRGSELTISISGAGIDPATVRLVQARDPLRELIAER